MPIDFTKDTVVGVDDVYLSRLYDGNYLRSKHDRVKSKFFSGNNLLWVFEIKSNIIEA